jgi:GDP-L-fucose synthase
MTTLVTGGSGLVGKAIYKIKPEYIYLSSKDCDLTNYEMTYDVFKKYNPTHVIHLAAYVGGLYKNMNQKVEMLEKNTLININVLKVCNELNINNVISCLSTCIFPDKTTYPIVENMLHDGRPHISNDAYAYSKRLLDTLSKSYREEYNRNYTCIIPTNIYGENDNYSLEDGHVIPALIHKAHLAKNNNEPFIIKGTGKPLRQFIYSQDLAQLIIWCLENYNDIDPIILADSKEYSIKEIGEIIAENFNIDNIQFDTSFSDGQYKKTASNQKLLSLLDFEFTDINIGLQKSCEWFIDNYENCRK